MNRKIWRRLLLVFLTFSLIAAACSDDDSGDVDVTEEPGVDEPDEEEPSGDDPEVAAGLADVCPSPLVIQTDWFPESEHGALYNLLGDGYSVDTGNKVVSGPMVAGGADLGIEFEIRTGGPAIGFAPVSSHMYTDDSIHLGYATTDGQILRVDDAPLLSVIAPLEKNPQIIMWDADAYPDIDTIAQLGEEGVTINIFGGGLFADVFVAQGIWTADQVDPSYDGSPARFVAEGNIAQQGFASAEPYVYENLIDEYGKLVKFQLLHDTGFEVYSQTIAIRPDDQADLDACLTAVVPIIQQSVLDYAASPGHANDIIVDAVDQYADFWVYDLGLADYSTATQIELGLVSNGSDGTVGNMDVDRIQSIIDQLTDAGMDVPDGLGVDAIVTNEYIDSSIGF